MIYLYQHFYLSKECVCFDTSDRQKKSEKVYLIL